MTPEGILVVAPYNAQVVRLRERLDARGIRVGTVDKFQGQEAPVVLYSLTSSSPEDAPRGMEFLYSATDSLFHKRHIHHLFCRTCGIKSFARGTGRDGQPMIAVNVRSLDGFGPDQFRVTEFDGRSR